MKTTILFSLAAFASLAAVLGQWAPGEKGVHIELQPVRCFQFFFSFLTPAALPKAWQLSFLTQHWSLISLSLLIFALGPGSHDH
jgi:hypothetical protein